MTKVKDGFYHQLSSKIGDNDYLLKAGGGYIGVGNGEYIVPLSNYSPNDALYARTSRNLLINGVTWYSNWYWSGQGGQPAWLWGSNDGTNMYVWDPSNFRVSYANSAGYADSAGYATSAGSVTYSLNWTDGDGTSQSYNGSNSKTINKLTLTTSASSWLGGQNTPGQAALHISDSTDTGSYWPWFIHKNTSSGRMFSLGVLNNSFYILGSTTSRTSNSYDYCWRFDLSNGWAYGNFENADTVDGYHSYNLWRSDGAAWNPGANVTLNQSGNGQEWSFDIYRNGYTGGYWHVWDSSYGSMLQVTADDGKVRAPYGFVGNLSGTADYATYSYYPYIVATSTSDWMYPDFSYYGNTFRQLYVYTKLRFQPSTGHLSIVGNFDGDPTKYDDGNDRPGISITGDYPQLSLIAGRVGNSSHGAVLSIGAYDSSGATSGAFKTFRLGTAGYNATWLDLAYGTHANVHDGVAGWNASGNGVQIVRFHNDRTIYNYGTAYFGVASYGAAYYHSGYTVYSYDKVSHYDYTYGRAIIGSSGMWNHTLGVNGDVGIATDSRENGGYLHIAENTFAIDFRPGHSSYGTGFTYGSYGNEYLALLTEQSVTSIIFGNGYNPQIALVGSFISNDGSNYNYGSSSDVIQIKQNCMNIGGVWTNGVGPDYKLKVNGKTYINYSGGDTDPSLTVIASSNGSWRYVAAFLAPNLTDGYNVYVPVGQSMSTRNAIGLTHYHYGSGSTSNYAAMEIWGVGNIQRWYYGDMRTWFAGRVDASGFYHNSYGSYDYLLTSNGDARHMNTLTVSNSDMLDGYHHDHFQVRHWTTQRDFADGTLIYTDINYSNWSGDPFYGVISGNTYGRIGSAYTTFQGYLWDDGIINYSVSNLGVETIGDIIAMNISGNLCFWFPRQSYWEGYSVEVYSAYDYRTNRVTNVVNSGDPGGNKRVNLNNNTYYNFHNGNSFWANQPVRNYSDSNTDPTFLVGTFTRNWDHGISVATIRGRGAGSCSGEYIHLYERVHIGSPNGWGSRNAPSYGLSTYGGAWLATDTGSVGIGTTSPSQKLHVSGGLLAVTCNGYTLTMGNQNSGWTHMQTSGTNFWFNPSVCVDGNVYPYYANNNWCGTSGNYWYRVCTAGVIHPGVWSSGHVFTTDGGYANIGSMDVNSAAYIRSMGDATIVTGRSFHYDGAYTYRSYNWAANSPMQYGAYIGFGHGSYGSAEIGVEWTGNHGIWYRSAGDWQDWSAWRRIFDDEYHPSADNSDTVDGYHASQLWRSDGAAWNPGANVTLNQSGNGQEWSFDIYRNGYTGGYWHVWDSSYGSMLQVTADDGKVRAPYGFVGDLSGNASSSTWSSYSYRLLNQASIGSSSDSHASALQNYFNSYKSSIYRNEIRTFYSSSYGNGSFYMGYFLSGYDSNPYGGFFVAHYDTPHYVGISNGSYSQQTILTSSNWSSYISVGGNYHPLGGSWKPSSLSSYTRHWGWAYSSAEAGLASNGSEMQIYTDGMFWQREGAYYCLDNGNTYVSSGTGVINGSTITQVSNSDTVDGYHASGLLTAASLGASGNSTTLSVTVGGTTKTGSVTVPYASTVGISTISSDSNYNVVFRSGNYLYGSSGINFNPHTSVLSVGSIKYGYSGGSSSAGSSNWGDYGVLYCTSSGACTFYLPNSTYAKTGMVIYCVKKENGNATFSASGCTLNWMHRNEGIYNASGSLTISHGAHNYKNIYICIYTGGGWFIASTDYTL